MYDSIYEVPRVDKFIEIESRKRGWEKREQEVIVYRLFEMVKKFWKSIVVMAARYECT